MQHQSINRPPQGQGKSKGKTLQQNSHSMGNSSGMRKS